MTMVYITVEKGDIVGITSRKKPYHEYTVAYRLVNKESDLGLGLIPYMSSGSKNKMIDEARKLAMKFRKEKSIASIINIYDCGTANGQYQLMSDGKFYKRTRLYP
jgi:hypothetical protein